MDTITVDRLTNYAAYLADMDTRTGLKTHRNLLLGLWAAQRLGLGDDKAEDYAWELHAADSRAPGHDDVVAKLMADFAAHGRPVAERVVRERLREMEFRAFLQLSGGDHLT